MCDISGNESLHSLDSESIDSLDSEILLDEDNSTIDQSCDKVIYEFDYGVINNKINKLNEKIFKQSSLKYILLDYKELHKKYLRLQDKYDLLSEILKEISCKK